MTKHAHEVSLDDDDYKWFKTTYPGVSLSIFFQLMFKEFRSQHRETPADIARRSAQEVRAMLGERS